MPILINLDRVLVERKMSLKKLSEHVGVTMANLSILKTGKAKAVRFSTLEAVCEALTCQPGDILEYVSDAPNLEPDSQPKPAGSGFAAGENVT